MMVGGIEYSVSSFFFICVNASFQTANLGIARDSVLSFVLCWLLLSVSWILLFLLVLVLTTRLSSFIGGPASGLCLLQFLIPDAV